MFYRAVLCGEPIGPQDKVTRRKVVSLKSEPIDGPSQMNIFDYEVFI